MSEEKENDYEVEANAEDFAAEESEEDECDCDDCDETTESEVESDTKSEDAESDADDGAIDWWGGVVDIDEINFW